MYKLTNEGGDGPSLLWGVVSGGGAGVGRGSNAGRGKQDVFQELRKFVSTAREAGEKGRLEANRYQIT